MEARGERSCEPMDKNRIEGVAEQGERARFREALVIKAERRKSGGCAAKECVLTRGDRFPNCCEANIFLSEFFTLFPGRLAGIASGLVKGVKSTTLRLLVAPWTLPPILLSFWLACSAGCIAWACAVASSVPCR